jgi:hypothetical protein
MASSLLLILKGTGLLLILGQIIRFAGLFLAPPATAGQTQAHTDT